MKASKIISALFIAQILGLIAPIIVTCQTETLDMMTYKPPKGWTKTPKNDAVAFSDINKTANAFCVMTVYPSMASSGEAAKDFANYWKTFVSKPFKIEENPKTETQNGDGWTITTAVAIIELDGGLKSLAMLTAFSGYGKTTSILVISNSETYTKAVSDFLESVKLDKTPLSANITTAVNPPNNSSIIGKWGDTTGGGYIGYGTTASQKQYTFNADGTYSFVYAGWSGTVGTIGAFHIKVQESGVYTLNGDSITITPKKSQKESNSDVKNNPLETVTYRWTVHYFEGSQYYALILHPDHPTVRDGETFDYVPLFPNSYCYSKAK